MGNIPNRGEANPHFPAPLVGTQKNVLELHVGMSLRGKGHLKQKSKQGFSG